MISLSASPPKTGWTQDDLEKLLCELDSRDKMRRQQAIDQARALPPEALLQLVDLERQSYTQKTRKAGALSLGVLMMTVAVLYLCYVFHIWDSPTAHALPVAVGAGFAALLWGIIGNRYQPIRARYALIQVLGTIQDLRFLDALFTLLRETEDDSGRSIVRQSLRQALRRLAPQLLDPHQKVISTPEQNRALRMLLSSSFTPYTDMELTLSILKTWEQIGDESVVPVVWRLANAPPATLKMARVRKAARECLSYVQLHVEEAKRTQTLLRPSAAPAETSDLLHPADPAGISVPEQLLRAVEKGPEERRH